MQIQQAIEDLKNQIDPLKAELKEVSELLEFDPKNFNLIKQKFYLLGALIKQTELKLKKLKQQQQAFERLTNNANASLRYRELTRAIAQTERHLRLLKQEFNTTGKAGIKNFRSMNGEATKLSKTLGGNSSSALGGLIGGAVAVGLNALLTLLSKLIDTLANFSKKAIEASTNLEAIKLTWNETFEKSSFKMFGLDFETIDSRFADKKTKKALKDYGMNEANAKKISSQFMFLGKQAGLSFWDGQKIALSSIGKVADLATVFGVSYEQVSEDWAGIFTGQTEGLLKYGVALSDANMQQYLFAQGINHSWSELSQSEQVIMRFNSAMGQLSTLHMKASQASNTWANQVHLLNQQWSQLLAIIGSKLTQLLLPALQMLNMILSVLLTIHQLISKVFGGKVYMALELHKVGEDVNNIAGGANNAGKGFSNANKEAKELAKTIAGFDQLNIIHQDKEMDSSGSGSTSAGGGIGGITPNISETGVEKGTFNDIIKWLEDLRAKLEPIKTLIDELVKKIGEDLSPILHTITTKFVEPFLKSQLDTFIDNISSTIYGITAICSDLWDLLADTGVFALIEEALDNIADTSIWKAMTGQEGGSNIVKYIMAFINPLNLIRLHIEAIMLAIQKLGDCFGIETPAIDEYFNNLRDQGTSTSNSTSVSMLDIVDSVRGGIQTAKKLWDGLQTKIQGFINFFSKIGSTIGLLTTPFVSSFTNAINNIKLAFTLLKQTISNIKISILTIFVNMCASVKSAVNNLITQLNRFKFSIPSWVPVIGGRSFSLNIPQLANGGIVNQSTLANIGEAGKEAVLPLERNTEWMDILANKINGGGSQPIQITLVCDKRELGKVAINSINDITKQSGQFPLAFSF